MFISPVLLQNKTSRKVTLCGAKQKFLLCPSLLCVGEYSGFSWLIYCSSKYGTYYLFFNSLGPLVGKVKEYHIESIVDNLCSNMLSTNEQLRDISSIGIKVFS